MDGAPVGEDWRSTPNIFTGFAKLRLNFGGDQTSDY